MILHDALCTAQAAQGLQREHSGSRALLDLPESLHYQLEIRSLDRLPRGGFGSAPAPGTRVPDRTGLDLPEHSLDQRRLDLDVVSAAGKLVVDAHRLDDRGPAGIMVEVLQPEAVCQQAGDLRPENVERGKRLLAQCDETIDPQARPQELRKLPDEASLVPLGA